MRPEVSVDMPAAALPGIDEATLARAHAALEHPSFAARLTNVIGTPIDVGLRLLPTSWHRRMHQTTEAAIHKALNVAATTVPTSDIPSANERLYQTLAAGSGAVSGLFGWLGLAIELPITTTLMLRTIAEIARAEGEDPSTLETQAACLEVFALGGRDQRDDAADTGYYGVRIALAGYLGASALRTGNSATATARFVSAVASRFGVSISERAAVQLLPVIGALGAATVNVVFMRHFQSMARGHFTVRRLERSYGAERIRARYDSLTPG